MNSTEENLYEQVARYMALKHPDVLYHFDLSGMWTSSHHLRNLYGRLNRRAFPDLFIYRTTMFDGTTNPCAGLALELKREGTKLKRTKDLTKLLKGDTHLRRAGDWWDAHIEEQAAVLDELRNSGYYAEFAVGLATAVMLIDSYLGGTFSTTGVEPHADGGIF